MAVSYNVYGNGGSGPIDYATPIGTTSGLTFATSALAFPGEWRFAVRATDGALEELNVDAAVRLVLDATGVDATNVPLSPVGLSAWAIAGGKVRVTWSYPTLSTAGVTGFRVYTGPTTPDYGAVAATVSAASLGRLRSFQADVGPFADGSACVVGVRAYNAAGEEGNTAAATATAVAVGPSAVDALTISTDPGDW